MLKDEEDFSYNGGGDARPMKTWSDFSSAPYETSWDGPRQNSYLI